MDNLTCIANGCEEPNRPKAGRELCDKHYRWFKRTGDPNKRSLDKKCVECGAVFAPNKISNQSICSEECRKTRRDKYNAQWIIDHPGYHSEWNKRWRKENPEEYKNSEREYRENLDPAVKRERFNNWLQSIGGSRWKIADEESRERMRNATRTNRAKRFSAPTYTVTTRDLERAFNRLGQKCSYCHTDLRGKTVTWDHIVPIVAGGVHSIGNLTPCCGQCNSSKGSSLLMEWRLFKMTGRGLKRRFYEYDES